MKAPLPQSTKVFKLHNFDLYQILGPAPEACFDDLVGLAAQLCRTPIAFYSSIDASCHWLKSQVGFDRTLAHHYLNFCDRAMSLSFEESALVLNPNSECNLVPEVPIAEPATVREPLVSIVRNACVHKLFADHPLVVAYPFVKFYAGMPVVTAGGRMLGVLSVMDCKPGDLTKEALNAMETLTRQVARLVELRCELVKAREAVAELENITDDRQQISELNRSNCNLFWDRETQQSDTIIFNTNQLPVLGTTGCWQCFWENSVESDSQLTVAPDLERSRLWALQDRVGVALGQGGTIPAILQRCTEAIVEHLDATAAIAWTFDSQTERLELQAASGIESADYWERAIQEWVAKHAGKLPTASAFLLWPGEPSPIAYPLIVEARLVGLLALNNSLATADGVLEVLSPMANAIAVAIDRVKAREELLSRREGLLFGLASQMRNSLDLDKILDTAVNEIRSLLQVDQCYFLWYVVSPPDRPSFTITHEAANPDLQERVTDYPIEQITLLAEKISHRQTLQIDDAARASCIEPATRNFLIANGIVSKLLLPLKTRAGQMGAVVCNHYSGVREWMANEVELLQAVVDQLAIAIDQAELYAQTRAAALAAETQARQLTKTLQNLQQKESQLIQNEKMSSLGQMVAGVAHEINNPVNFIYGNLTYCEQYIKDILGLLRLYQTHYPEPCEEILDKSEEIDIDFVVPDLLKILSSMEMGAERIRQIVLSLRNFSRHDEAEKKPVDIHEGIDSTLLILHSRLKAHGLVPGIEVVKEYGVLPKVECYPGQLNQVFMNIIGNAIDALENRPAPKIIKIRTEVVDRDWQKDSQDDRDCKDIGRSVLIRIQDNGPGLTEKAASRLFDPFFTTKPVGKGTGLGLSISYQIVVEKHGGSLKCTSEPGQGAEFWVQIPIAPPAVGKN